MKRQFSPVSTAQETAARAPRDGERCGSLVYSAEWRRWEYVGRYDSDVNEPYVRRQAEHLHTTWDLEFTVARLYNASETDYTQVIFTVGDPRPLVIRL